MAIKFDLTTFEKRTLIHAIEDGYFWDDINDDFITWGFTGKKERGAASSMVQKGLIRVERCGGDTYIYSNISKKELLDLLGYDWKEDCFYYD